MSAFIVDKEHIDALVDAAMSVKTYMHDSGLRWWACDLATLRHSDWQEMRREISYSDHDRAHEVGMMLWAENLASLDARYPDCAETGEYPGPCDFTPDSVLTYQHTPYGRNLSPVQVLKAIACYEYQTCEHDGWPTSEALSFCEALRQKMISSLPGYQDASWELQNA